MTYGLTAMYPNITNGIVLTGFSQVPQFMAYFALGGNFAPVSDNEILAEQYDIGYIAPKDSIGVQINFFGPDDFDPEILKVATKTGQPAAIGELLTVGSGPKSSDFSGPVMIITGGTRPSFHGLLNAETNTPCRSRHSLLWRELHEYHGHQRRCS